MVPASTRPPPKRHWWESTKRIPRPPEPELARSPAGHHPHRRRPWRARAFDKHGKPLNPADGQYKVDRDGYAILTTDGQLVTSLEDEDGQIILDEQGNGILTTIEVREGAEVRFYPTQT